MTHFPLQGDLTVSGDGHYDPKDDVLLRLEAMTSNETRVSFHLFSRMAARE